MKRFFWMTFLLCAMTAAAGRPAKPNVMLILTDDLGWQDVKCYDVDKPCPFETPNMDRLATKGVKFWQAYSPAPTCAPTRAAVLSGIHPARAQMTHVSGGVPPAPHHIRGWSIMSPWYRANMPAETVTIAEALKPHGYVSGHAGKWHVGNPPPPDQGFDFTRSHRGAHGAMHPHRLTGFATNKEGDPYRLDENGFPFHQNHEDAMTFLRENHDKPFFLYYATWLVHGPIHTRSEALLNKYVKKLGIELTEDARKTWKREGQNDPFYAAMVEELDYYFGKLCAYLETTDDPRWPGHKLIENTYIIFTSDNGGATGAAGPADNTPLSEGKISVMEGGTRVPLIITGPGIPAGVESDVLVNGLDFYPTILAWTGAPKPKGKHFDGLDLSNLLLTDPADPSLVKEADGRVRDTMVWHFPNSAAQESSIRIGDYKLVRNYQSGDPVNKEPPLELYRLYNSADGKPVRVDIEEDHSLVESMPEKTAEMNRRLTEVLTEMKASYPYYNPDCPRALPNKEKAPEMVSHQQTGDAVEFAYRENGAKVVQANLIYTRNGDRPGREWYQTEAELLGDHKGSVTLPEGTTHYFINLVDENRFLRSYPKVVDEEHDYKDKVKFAERALKANL